MSAQKLNFELPSSLALQRVGIISDAKMYSEVNGEYAQFPVEVIRHGIRATKNINMSGSSSGETSTTVDKEDVRNPQIIESAKLHANAQRLVVEFSYSFTNLASSLASISPDKGVDRDYLELFRASIDNFIERGKNSNGLVEVTNRFARNILNGRWLWRNRLIASKITIEVTQENEEVVRSDALSIPLNKFENYSAQEQKLGAILMQSLKGEKTQWLLVRAFVEPMGCGAIEVFPSQNYYDKPKQERSGSAKLGRTLYVYNKPKIIGEMTGPTFVGYAAIRDQKIGNALRTFDTWYDQEADFVEPIAVEPMGANLKELKFFRPKKKSAFDMLKRLNEIDPNSHEGMFMIASFIRGGVFTRS